MSVDGAQLWTLNQRLLGVVMDACTGELAELGLETKEFFVLAEVEASPYPAEIATALLLPKASVTVYVRNLVAKGFVRREIDEADLRRHRLVLTAEGTQARDRALAALAAEYDRRLARVTPRTALSCNASSKRCSPRPPQAVCASDSSVRCSAARSGRDRMGSSDRSGCDGKGRPPQRMPFSLRARARSRRCAAMMSGWRVLLFCQRR